MVRTGEDAQYQYLPIECPKCGLQGKVKISRLDQSFTCKKCKKVFHVTLDGVVLGERPPDAPPSEMGFVTADERSPWLVRRFEQLSRVGQWVVLGLIGLGCAYGASKLMEPAAPLPGEVEDRAELAAKAFGHGDWKTLKRLAKPRTTGDLWGWYENVHPKDWDDVTNDSAIEVQLDRPKPELQGYAKTKPILTLLIRAQIDVKGKPPCKIDLIWSEDEHAEWWLDGERLLKTCKRPARNAPKEQTEKKPAT